MKKSRKQVIAALNRRKPLRAFVGTQNASFEDVQQAPTENFECEACNTELQFATNVDNFGEPVCPNCGGTCHASVDSSLDEEVDELQEEEVAEFTCLSAVCGAKNVVEARLVTALNGSLVCASCGTLHAVNFDDEDLTDTSSEPILADDDSSEYDNVDGDDSDDFDEGEEESSFVDDDDFETIASDDESEDLSEEPLDEVEMSDLVSEDEPVSIMLDDSQDDVALVAFVGNVATHRLTAEDAGDNADIMGTESFQDALETAANKDGVKTLLEAGFKPVVASLKIGNIVAKRVEAALADERKVQVASVQDTRTNLQNTMALASKAIAVGFYRRQPSQLVASIAANLEAIGVPNAKRVALTAVSASLAAHNQQVFELAETLEDKDANFRNDLAEQLDEMSPSIVADVEPDEEVVEDDFLSEDTVTAALYKGSTKKQTVTASTDLSDVAAAAQFLRKSK